MNYENFFLFSCWFCVLFVSCTPQRQLQRLHSKHPQLFEQSDTIISLQTKEVNRDTIYFSHTEIVRDTFRIDSIGYIYIHRTTIGDSLGVNINIPSDTLKVPVMRYNIGIADKDKVWSKIYNILIFAGILYLIGQIVKLITSRWSKN